MKSKKIIPALLFTALLVPTLASCGNEGEKQPDNVLKIVVKSAGFGDAWINKIKESFQAKHPDVTVEINALYDTASLIESHLKSSKNEDDLYISVGDKWRSYAASGYFAELDDLLEEEVDGVKVKNKVADEFENSLYFEKSNGEKHSYRLPWTSGVGGIFYNKKMFEQNGWSVPTTFDELVSLCDTINAAEIATSDGLTAVKPFAYTGQNTDYFDYTVFSWWSQIVGKNAIDEFLKYKSANIFDVTQNETYQALKTATKHWDELFNKSNKADKSVTNYIEGSNSKDAPTAQKEFLNGYAAMMFNGDWLYNELLNYSTSETASSQFELGLMKTPALPEAKEEYLNTTYVTGEDQYIAIPSSSNSIDLAKEFIKEIISDKGCATFTQNANAFLAYDCDYSKVEIADKYVKDVIALRNNYVNKFTNYSNSRIYLTNTLNIWSSSANRPYLSLLNQTVTVDGAFTTIANYAKANWADWEYNAQ
ncbi:MAG: extracellular solute-binding protein [Erysipelotrichaceae bacterium]|nr:extracellular solute-binding protein [Erysipelotrichaceae bacterium]